MQEVCQLYESMYKLFTSETLLMCSHTPKDLDSTTLSKLALNLVFSSKAGIGGSCTVTPDNASILHRLFDSMASTKSPAVLGYGLKDVFTFFSRLNHKPLKMTNVFDMSWYESYLNLESSSGDLYLMLSNFKSWVKNKDILNIYQKIYSKLITSTLPAIESFALLNDNANKLVFPTYKLEGQENGRLSCTCDRKRCYNPHSLGEEKKSLKLHNFGNVLYQFDYKNMEVSVLAILSKDKNLLDIVHGPHDVYETIFAKVTGLTNHENARNFGKKMFLPVIYGQTPSGMSKSLDISIDQAQIYFEKLLSIFPDAFGYVESFQKSAQQNREVEDKFGRRRSVKVDEAYKARNFAIQSPAALICLESLVKLDQESNSLYKIAFHVHDGYYLACKQSDMLDVYQIAKSILETKSEFMPDLKLTVATNVGKSLDKLVSVNRKVAS